MRKKGALSLLAIFFLFCLTEVLPTSIGVGHLWRKGESAVQTRFLLFLAVAEVLSVGKIYGALFRQNGCCVWWCMRC